VNAVIASIDAIPTLALQALVGTVSIVGSLRKRRRMRDMAPVPVAPHGRRLGRRRTI